MSKKSYHNPQGEPCAKCGLSLLKHRVDHKVNGEPCKKCGLPVRKHRIRKQIRKRTYKSRICYIGIDGEGQGRKDHRYVLLAASSEKGDRVWSVEDDRLSTVQCLELILSLPTTHTKIFSYSFNYDLTKILTDLDNKSLFQLFRPELRQRHGPDAAKGPYPVEWKGYRLNLQGTKFTVRKGRKKVIIWDLFKFFQGKFVKSLTEWKVGNKELWDRMSSMKDKRAEFDKEKPEDVKAYCLEECKCIAELAHKLIDSHETAGLQLKTFYGAGSSGAAMLSVMGIREKIRTFPDEMRIPVASAFAGGRFENSIIGEIQGLPENDFEIYNRDLSSAYPYHISFLPCLLHGKWRLSKNRNDLDNCRTALIHYGLGFSNITSWGPFPFRTDDGSISFPIQSGGGWVWKEEYLAGERIFPHVQFKEAWVYECDCQCQPFAQIPVYYILRLKLGKEGPGIVIKLGCNSCYGKLAQSVGNALFNSWIWAGMITSGCRAQVLDILGLHKDWGNLLAVATDGIYTREKINAPLPKDTGTGDIWIPNEKTGIMELKPVLGGWENKTYKRGMFFARPGVYFPTNPSADDIRDVRARGIGKGVILEHCDKIVDSWKTDGIEGIARVPDVTRFCGAKTSISRSQGGKVYKRAAYKDGIRPAYGQWIKRKVEMSFHPLPKRAGVNKDGVTLTIRKFSKNLESVPYSRALISNESRDLMIMQAEAIEQPDGDLTEYE